MSSEANTDAEQIPEVPDGIRDGDMLVYVGGRLHIVDHLVPEAFDIDLVALDAEDTANHTTP